MFKFANMTNTAALRHRPSRVEVLTFGALAALMIAAERDGLSVPFTALCGLTIAATALLVTGRPRFSAWLAMAMLSLSAVASALKYPHLAINAHIVDLHFYLTNADAVTYLLEDFRWPLLAGVAALGGFLGFNLVMFRRSAPRPGARIGAALALPALAAATVLAFPKEAETFSYHIRKNHLASSFFASFFDLGRLLRPDPLSEAASRVADAQPFAPAARCAAAPGAPDIVLVLGESAMAPSLAPGWRTPPQLADAFRSFDGRSHHARVEAFGGGTWISHTSVLSGLSMAEFGWMRPYATVLLKERLRHGLPGALAACGYKTAAVSPMSYYFVNEGSMITALGVEDYLDRQRIGAPSKHEPDSFYFSRAADYYSAHVRTDGRPLFLFVITMAAHPPYDFRLQPTWRTVGEPLDADPLVAEYLRRSVMAQTDYESFLATLEDRRGSRPLLAAQFGDHQPALTLTAFQNAGAAVSPEDFRSPLYLTSYSVITRGFAPNAPLPGVEALDLAYLAPTLLEIAGLPLDPPFRALADLRDRCGGAFHTCADRAAVELYLARMVRSGLIMAPRAN